MIHTDEILESILSLVPMITEILFKNFQSSDILKDLSLLLQISSLN